MSWAPASAPIRLATSLTDAARAVLITRPSPAAEETARQVSALGLRPIVTPLMMIQRIPADLPQDAAAVLITSGNAVVSLPTWARARPLFAVGDATAERAHAEGFTHVLSANGDASDLAALVHRTLPPQLGQLLLLTGKGQGAALTDLLHAQQRDVAVREVYEAVAVPTLPARAAAALQDADLRAAMLFSAETARQFVRLVTAAGLEASTQNTDACAISQATGVALEALRWRRIRIASRPNQEEMLALLE
jgi:uroporphyrinogen-III synthase